MSAKQEYRVDGFTLEENSRTVQRLHDLLAAEASAHSAKRRTAMPKITGSIVDAATGEPIPARVQVLVSTGETVHPPDAILKVGPGAPFFYADGAFEVDAPRGAARVVAERGTEYAPATLYLDIPASGVVAADIRMERWNELALQAGIPAIRTSTTTRRRRGPTSASGSTPASRTSA